jgi:hypothetical protein
MTNAEFAESAQPARHPLIAEHSSKPKLRSVENWQLERTSGVFTIEKAQLHGHFELDIFPSEIPGIADE